MLTATIQAPANLSAVVSAVTAPASSVATQITSLGGAVPALSTATNALATTLTTALNGVSALAGGAELRVAELSSTSDFAPQPAAATPSSGGELPRTGQDTAPFAVFGILALALAVALVRWLRRPLPTD